MNTKDVETAIDLAGAAAALADALGTRIDWPVFCGLLLAAEQLRSDLAEARKRVAELEAGILRAFVQGAEWWEWERENATMWTSDRESALCAAEKRAADGTLGHAAAQGSGEG